ncbi:MAG TPA: hypothetical protein K8V18_09205 [Proteus mirabilis]|nr:hypothetical protein [Proteus mirabilis]
MHEELFNRLIFIAEHDDILITEVLGKANDPDVAFCKDRIININRNYDSPISVAFRLAHEISHIRFSQPSFLYQFSPYIKNKEERETNERAIRIIARLVYMETPNEYRNWSDFMNEFNLPSWFEPLVKDLIYD